MNDELSIRFEFFSSYIAPPNINNGPEVRMSELENPYLEAPRSLLNFLCGFEWSIWNVYVMGHTRFDLNNRLHL
jgi:hypothetical protein